MVLPWWPKEGSIYVREKPLIGGFFRSRVAPGDLCLAYPISTLPVDRSTAFGPGWDRFVSYDNVFQFSFVNINSFDRSCRICISNVPTACCVVWWSGEPKSHPWSHIDKETCQDLPCTFWDYSYKLCTTFWIYGMLLMHWRDVYTNLVPNVCIGCLLPYHWKLCPFCSRQYVLCCFVLQCLEPPPDNISVPSLPPNTQCPSCHWPWWYFRLINLVNFNTDGTPSSLILILIACLSIITHATGTVLVGTCGLPVIWWQTVLISHLSLWTTYTVNTMWSIYDWCTVYVRTWVQQREACRYCRPTHTSWTWWLRTQASRWSWPRPRRASVILKNDSESLRFACLFVYLWQEQRNRLSSVLNRLF